MPYPLTIAASETLRTGSSLYLCALWEITRRDGTKIRITSHDRDLTFKGKTFSTGILATIGDMRRRAGNESSASQCNGLIDGDKIALPAIKANKFQDAMVEQAVVDWRRPWITFRVDRWWITSVVDDGEGVFIGMLESRASRMQQNAGGRFGGLFTNTCIYNLGDPNTCKKDISADIYTGVTVATVDPTRPRYLCAMTVGTWPAGSPARYDDYYRGGEVQWTTGNNAGEVTEILYYTHSTRSLEFLLPTPRPMVVGDQGTVRPGCDGLKTTCQQKFNNYVNWGAVPNQNDAQGNLNPDTGGNDP